MEHGPDLFESAWLKWAWAKAHAHLLKANINAWGRDPDRDLGLSLGTYYDPKRHRIEVFIRELDPLPIAWAVVIGDAAHNYRSCLDHIAWALVTRGRTPPDKLSDFAQSRVGFPIYTERGSFNSALARQLPGVRRSDIAIVRRYQPYHGGERRSARHAFEALRRLSKDDKHRTIQPALLAPRGSMYHVHDPRDCTITRIPASFVLWEPLQVGTHLAPIYVRKTGPNPRVKVGGHLAMQPGLQQGVLLGEWLEVLDEMTSRLLKDLSDPPTELLAKLDVAMPSG